MSQVRFLSLLLGREIRMYHYDDYDKWLNDVENQLDHEEAEEEAQ